jgi:hypothetical protein
MKCQRVLGLDLRVSEVGVALGLALLLSGSAARVAQASTARLRSPVAYSGRSEHVLIESSTRPTISITSPPEAIADLNKQRAANGIPTIPTENAELSQGCIDHTTKYVTQKGAYPHTEEPQQPGYTPLGELAASKSDLAYHSPISPQEEWGPESNPWLDAPMHLADLFAPDATSVWYGESSTAACMGTELAPTPPSAPPSFYSLPGNEVNNVAATWNADEEPFTPGQAVGIPTGRSTGPYIFLWSEGGEDALSTATLTGPAGEAVPVRLVTPSTPAPPSPPPFPPVETMAGYGPTNYVIPPSPLKIDSTYTVTAIWTGRAPYAQVFTFHTGKLTESQYYQELKAPTGQIDYKLSASTLQISGEGTIVGRPLTITVKGCALEHFRSFSEVSCPGRRTPALAKTTITITSTPVTIRMPHSRHKRKVGVLFQGPPFSAIVAGRSYLYKKVAFSDVTTLR